MQSLRNREIKKGRNVGHQRYVNFTEQKPLFNPINLLATLRFWSLVERLKVYGPRCSGNWLYFTFRGLVIRPHIVKYTQESAILLALLRN